MSPPSLTPEAALTLNLMRRKGPQDIPTLCRYMDRPDRPLAELLGYDLIVRVSAAPVRYAARNMLELPEGRYYCAALDAVVTPQTCSARMHAKGKWFDDSDLSIDTCRRCSRGKAPVATLGLSLEVKSTAHASQAAHGRINKLTGES